MIIPGMNKVEVNKQIWNACSESPFVSENVKKFHKACRKLPKGRITMSRKFIHKATNQTYILSMFQNNGLASINLLAEVDHGSQKWYYNFNEQVMDPMDVFSTHFFRRYAEREGYEFKIPEIITRYIMENCNTVKIYESEDAEESAYASRNGIDLCRAVRQLGFTRHCTYVSRDMLGPTQEQALQVIVKDLDRIETTQRQFKPLYKSKGQDAFEKIDAIRDWSASAIESHIIAKHIYKQYFEEENTNDN